MIKSEFINYLFFKLLVCFILLSKILTVLEILYLFLLFKECKKILFIY